MALLGTHGGRHSWPRICSARLVLGIPREEGLVKVPGFQPRGTVQSQYGSWNRGGSCTVCTTLPGYGREREGARVEKLTARICSVFRYSGPARPAQWYLKQSHSMFCYRCGLCRDTSVVVESAPRCLGRAAVRSTKTFRSDSRPGPSIVGILCFDVANLSDRLE